MTQLKFINDSAPSPDEHKAIHDAAYFRQHHHPSCPGCDLCMTGTNKPDRSYPDAPDIGPSGSTLKAGT